MADMIVLAGMNDEAMNHVGEGTMLVLMDKDKCRKFWKRIKEDERVTVTFDLTPRKVWADPRVLRAAGQAAVMKGPVVFCAEGVDNGENLRDITLLENSKINSLLIDIQPATLATLEQNARYAGERDRLRARIVRSTLSATAE